MPLAPAATVTERFPRAPSLVLAAQDVSQRFIDEEVAQMTDCRLTTTTNRTVVGIMNEFTRLAATYSASRNERLYGIDLSPAAVVVSTLIGGSLAGFAGALLALPVAATIKVVTFDVILAGRVSQPPPEHPAPPRAARASQLLRRRRRASEADPERPS